MQGYVYLLSNESLPGLLKIGITARDPFARALELHTTGVPTAFTVVATLLVADAAATERQLHSRLDAHRVNQGREFFRIDLRMAVQALFECAEALPGGAALAPLAVGAAPMPPQDDRVQQALALLEQGPNFNSLLAEKLLTRAAKDGSALAHYHLALRIDRYSTPKNRKRYIQHLEEAAAGNLTDAYRLLVEMRDTQYLAGYLAREPDAEQAREVATEIFLYYLKGNRWQQELSENLTTPYFHQIAPDIDHGLRTGYERYAVPFLYELEKQGISMGERDTKLKHYAQLHHDFYEFLDWMHAHRQWSYQPTPEQRRWVEANAEKQQVKSTPEKIQEGRVSFYSPLASGRRP